MPERERLYRMTGQIRGDYPSKSFSSSKKTGMAPITPRTTPKRGRSRTVKSRSIPKMRRMTSRTQSSGRIGSLTRAITPMQAARSRSRVRFNPTRIRISRGVMYTGSRGRFKPGKSKSQLYTKTANGSIKKIEVGGVETVNTYKAAYLGHAAAANQVLDSVGRAIIKLVANKSQILIKEWGELPPFLTTKFWWIQIFTKFLDGATATSIFYYVDPTKTWYEHGAALTNKIQDQAVAQTSKRIQLGQILFGETASAVSTVFIETPRINFDLNDVSLNFEFYSNLKMQNTTVATSTVEADPDIDLEENIANNPLVGKLYTSKEWKNGFQLAKNNLTLTEDSGLLFAHIDYGYINFDSDVGASNSTGTYTNNPLTKPPPPWLFQSTRATNISVNPGEIRNSRLKFKTTMRLNTFIMKYFYELIYTTAGAGAKNIIPFGPSEMVGLEKQLDSRNETGAPIKLSWQLDQTYICHAKIKYNLRSTPIVEINSTGVNYTGT